MYESSKDHVRDLIARAGIQMDSGDAMRYSQAAVNAANAIAVITELSNKPNSGSRAEKDER